MYPESRLLSLIARIYEAALDPPLWASFLAELTTAIGAVGSGLYVQDFSSQRANVDVAVGLDPVYLKEYEDYFSGVNVWIQHGKDQMRPGTVITGPVLCPEPEVLRSEYYNDCLRRYDLFRPIGGVILQEGSLSSLVTSWRSRRAADFEPDDVALLNALLPHLAQACRIHRRVAGLAVERDTSADILDSVASAVVLTDGNAHILFMNRAARSIVAARDGLTAPHNRLAAGVNRETAALRALIAQAARATSEVGLPPGGALSVSRSSAKRPLIVLVTPLAVHSQPGIDAMQPAVAIFVTDPEAAIQPDEAILRRLYRLTRTEAEVAAMLTTGLRLADIAEQLGIAKNTVRWHAKNVFQKTSTRGQADLIRLLLSGPATSRARTP